MSQTEVIFCNACAQETRHAVKGTDEQTWPLMDNSGEECGLGWRRLTLLVCQGCGSGTLREIVSSTEDPPDSNKPTYYPPRRKRRFPGWLFEMLLNSTFDDADRYFSVRGLLEEIYAALANQHYRLAAMGTRALIEFIMIDSVGDQGNFAENIKSFRKKGYISQRQKSALTVALDVGSAAIHRTHNPTVEDINFGLSVAETLLQMIFVQEPQSRTVAKRIPSRMMGAKRTVRRKKN